MQSLPRVTRPKGRTLRPSLTWQHHVKESDAATRVWRSPHPSNRLFSSPQIGVHPETPQGPFLPDKGSPCGLWTWQCGHPGARSAECGWGREPRAGRWTLAVIPSEPFGTSGGQRLQGNCGPILRTGRHHGQRSGSRPRTWTSCAPGRLTVEASRAFWGVFLQPQGSGTVGSHVWPGREASP